MVTTLLAYFKIIFHDFLGFTDTYKVVNGKRDSGIQRRADLEQ